MRPGPTSSPQMLDPTPPFAPTAVGLFAARFGKEPLMLDLIVLALGLIFFVATIAYAYACDIL